MRRGVVVNQHEEGALSGRPVAATASEHLVNVFKAILATAPFCGGIASLMSDYIPSRRMKRLEDFAADVARDLNALREQVQTERIETDEYAFIFERGLRGAADFPQEEKLEAFRGILVNSLLANDLTQDQREFFLTLAERLSPVHLRILRFMSDPLDYLASMSIPEAAIHGGFSTFFPVALPGVGLAVIKAAFADLRTFGLTTTGADIFSTMTSAQGLELLRGRLTPLANDFVKFCTSPA